MSLLREILSRPEFEAEPPVLVDVGASGEIHGDWRALAPFSICLAFEPDARERGWIERSGSGFRRLVVYRAIASDRDAPEAELHLTRSPYCSSTLKPRADRLAAWAFHDRFEVTGTARVPAVTLGHALAEQGLERVDWFKTDSQGTDLRLFLSLGEARARRTLAVQMEPGILEAYEGEDTLADSLARLPSLGFWVSELHLRGTARLSARARAALASGAQAHAGRTLKVSPGWGEATFLNALEGEWSVRDRLLAWVIASLRQQHGFALELAIAGGGADPDFRRLRAASAAAVARGAWRFPAVALVRRLRSLAERAGWM